MKDTKHRFLKIMAGIVGAQYVLAAIGLLFFQRWFFDNVAPFEPFNRHYMGDTGSFTLAIGLGMLVAARDPVRHRLMIWLGLLASVVHTLNHVYDAVLLNEPMSHWLLDVGPLALLLVALAVAMRGLPRDLQ